MDIKFMRIIGMVAVLLMLGFAPAAAQNPLGLQVGSERPAGAQDCVTQYGLPTREQVRHPSFYQETGIDDNSFEDLCVLVRADFTLIVVGFEVNGVDNGVYMAIDVDEDSYVSIEHVTDGFVAVVWDPWAKDEMKFRLDQAVEFGWAHDTILIPSEWMDEFQVYGS